MQANFPSGPPFNINARRGREGERGIPFHDLIDDVIAAKFTAQFGFVLARPPPQRARAAAAPLALRSGCFLLIGRWLQWFMIPLSPFICQKHY